MIVPENQGRSTIFDDSYEVEAAAALACVNLEHRVARVSKGDAEVVLFSRSMPACFFFDPERVRETSEGALVVDGGPPPGLLIDEEAHLSAILANVLSMRRLLEAAIPVTLLLVQESRPKAYPHAGLVVPHTRSLWDRYGHRLTVLTIPQEIYNENKGSVPYATYRWPHKKAVVLARESGLPVLNRITLRYNDWAAPHVRKLVEVMFMGAIALISRPVEPLRFSGTPFEKPILDPKPEGPGY